MSKKHRKHAEGHGPGQRNATESQGRYRQAARDAPPSSALWAAATEELAGTGTGLIGARTPLFPGRAAKGIVTVEPGSACDLGHIDPDADGGLDKEAAKQALAAERARIAALQNKLYAERRQSLLVVLQAIDTGGKDGTIRSVFEGVNPQGCRVTSFKVPSSEELDHDFLWRYHKAVPARGMIGVFNRSHYEDVLVVRVKDLVPETVWRGRYGLINDFERMLAESGTTILKLFLHISKAEQRERLQARIDDPEKHWKFDPADLTERRSWDAYREAFDDALTRCSTPCAPWHVVPANRKWFRNLVVARTIADTLEAMDPRYPDPVPGVSEMRVPE
ncbi:polyphosphate kinase 2 family protein [Methylobacterium sp. sgz302541]|uniref:polyphosphate kinase 2 family protein n=1 Tax=unclassified Methylobacterium TaxID=2615210 RepID=UPI003D34B9DD